MALPDLSPEKRAEIERLARQRMAEGLEILSENRAILAAAVETNDLGGMQQAAAEMRAGVAKYESGIAALRALEDGQAPSEIALSWFRSEMSLVSSIGTKPDAIVSGMTPFHMTICVLLILFAAAMVWMYLLRMRRAAELLRRMSELPEARGVEPGTAASTRRASPAGAEPTPWSGVLRVAATYAETPNVKTFRFVDPAGGPIPFEYLSGQFLRLSLEIDDRPVKRAYTIASAPTRHGYIEITVKREEHGLVSRYLHDRVSAGDLLHVTASAGTFTFTGSEHDSIVLIAGGVGITPLMSVARALTDIGWEKEIYFLYSCRSPEEFIFRQELEYLRCRNPNLHLAVTFSRAPEEVDGFHRGRMTKEWIASSVPNIAARRVHLCGTPAMAKSVKGMLAELGVPSSQVHFEAFGTEKRKPGAGDVDKRPTDEESPTATFSISGKSGPLPVGLTILEAAEAIGVEIDNACRSGTCGSCKVRLESGSVTMEVDDALSEQDKEDGMILGCQATSDADVTVEA
jgi:ferredoxin-NADP reductase